MRFTNATKRYRYSARRSPPPQARFKQAKRSFGVIILDKTSRVLLVQRKDSFGYLACIDNEKLGHEKVSEPLKTITLQERDKILSLDWDQLWEDCQPAYATELYKKQCQARFEWLGIREIVAAMDQRGEQWQPENSWGLPKGRMSKTETALRCALREVQEETGLTSDDIRVDDSVGTFKDTYIGTDGKQYSATYYAARLVGTDEGRTHEFDETEVRQIRWATLEECQTNLTIQPSTCLVIEQTISKLQKLG